MDPEVWALIQDIQKHIDVLNREMGAVMVNIEWLTWWAQGTMGAIGLTFIATVANLVILLKNRKA